MDLPSDLIINSLNSFCVCFFKDITFSPESGPHFYIVVPLSDDTSVLLVIITSQIKKKTDYYFLANPRAIASLIQIDDTTLPFLAKESAIDCNRPFLFTKEELKNRIDPDYKFEVKARDIPGHLKEQILKAIRQSPMVKDYIKNLLRG